MSLQQRLSEFRFNLETLDLMTTMGRNAQEASSMLSDVGLNQTVVNFMVSQRSLLNMVLLRLQLYSEQNMTEQKVRAGLNSLNNSSINHLLDYLYPSNVKNTSALLSPSSSLKNNKVETPQEPEQNKNDEEHNHNEEEGEEGEEEEESHFETFFRDCVKKSDDPTNVVKMSELYNVFTKWWNEHYEDEVSTKDELKEFLSEKLGQKIKSTVSHISLL
jgi:ribosomal protein L12E/L44/L45/RPP1/RPP2